MRKYGKLACKCLTALLTLTETRLKDPRYRQNKRMYKILYLVPDIACSVGIFQSVESLHEIPVRGRHAGNH